jgi:hypothetical protein
MKSGLDNLEHLWSPDSSRTVIESDGTHFSVRSFSHVKIPISGCALQPIFVILRSLWEKFVSPWRRC